MSNIDNKYILIQKEELKKAYLFIANEFLVKENKKISDEIIYEIKDKSILQLLKILVYFISIDKCAFNNNSIKFSFNHLSSILIQACPKILADLNCINLHIFIKNNASFKYLSADHVEEIGIVYDILQNYVLSVLNGKLILQTNNKYKKKNGSYYTPVTIVDFIVRNTLGRFIDYKIDKFNKTKKTEPIDVKYKLIKDLMKVKILDPSVGGGIFLIRVIRYFEKKIKELCTGTSNIDMNTVFDKFISECIYGFDIDPVAVEITIISLYLLSSTDNTNKLLTNIVCSNSLNYIITNRNISNVNDDITNHIIHKEKGFDIIISNPPYQFGEHIPNSIKELIRHYKFAAGQYDVYWLFYELAFQKLLKKDGYHGYIIPDAFLTRDDVGIIRENLRKYSILDIWHVGSVFNLPKVSAIVLIWQKNKLNKLHNINIKDKDNNHSLNKQILYSQFQGNKFWIYLKTYEHFQLIEKMKQNNRIIGDIAIIHRGEELGKNSFMAYSKDCIGILSGKKITPFKIYKPSLYVKDLGNIIKKKIYIGEKILIRKTGTDLIAAIDKNNTIFLQSVYSLNIQEKILVSTSFNLLKVLLGFLNSRLLNFYIYHTFTAYKLIYPQLNQSTILEIPIPDNFVKTDWNKLINTVDKRTCCNEEAIPQIQAEIDSIVNSAYKLNKKECNLVNEHQTRLSFKR